MLDDNHKCCRTWWMSPLPSRPDSPTHLYQWDTARHDEMKNERLHRVIAWRGRVHDWNRRQGGDGLQWGRNGGQHHAEHKSLQRQQEMQGQFHHWQSTSATRERETTTLWWEPNERRWREWAQQVRRCGQRTKNKQHDGDGWKRRCAAPRNAAEGGGGQEGVTWLNENGSNSEMITQHMSPPEPENTAMSQNDEVGCCHLVVEELMPTLETKRTAQAM